MTSEHIYEYWKTKPSYAPTTFDIVGPPSGVDTASFMGLAEALSAIYGGAAEPDIDVEYNEEQAALVIGAAAHSTISASTAEPELKELFAGMKSSRITVHKAKRRKHGSAESSDDELSDDDSAADEPGDDVVFDTCPTCETSDDETAPYIEGSAPRRNVSVYSDAPSQPSVPSSPRRRKTDSKKSLMIEPEVIPSNIERHETPRRRGRGEYDFDEADTDISQFMI